MLKLESTQVVWEDHYDRILLDTDGTLRYQHLFTVWEYCEAEDMPIAARTFLKSAVLVMLALQIEINEDFREEMKITCQR